MIRDASESVSSQIKAFCRVSLLKGKNKTNSGSPQEKACLNFYGVQYEEHSNAVALKEILEKPRN